MARKLSAEYIKTKAYQERHGLKLVQVLLPPDYRKKLEKLSRLYGSRPAAIKALIDQH